MLPCMCARGSPLPSHGPWKWHSKYMSHDTATQVAILRARALGNQNATPPMSSPASADENATAQELLLTPRKTESYVSRVKIGHRSDPSIGNSNATTNHQLLKTIQVLREDYQDASKRASLLSAENIQLREKTRRLQQSLLDEDGKKLGISEIEGRGLRRKSPDDHIDTGREQARFRYLESELDKITEEYKVEMEQNIVYQQRMMNEIVSLKAKNEQLLDDCAKDAVNGLSPSSPMTDNMRKEAYNLRRQLAYAQEKLKNRFSTEQREFEIKLRRKDTYIVELEGKLRQAESKFEEAETEIVDNIGFVRSKVAFLLASSSRKDGPPPVDPPAVEQSLALEVDKLKAAVAQGKANEAKLAASFEAKENIYMHEIEVLKTNALSQFRSREQMYKEEIQSLEDAAASNPVALDSAVEDGKTEELKATIVGLTGALAVSVQEKKALEMSYKAKEQTYREEITSLRRQLSDATSAVPVLETVVDHGKEEEYEKQIEALQKTVEKLTDEKDTHWQQMHLENEALEAELHETKGAYDELLLRVQNTTKNEDLEEELSELKEAYAKLHDEMNEMQRWKEDH